MSCHPASTRQKDYADSLVEYLEKERHRSATRFKTKVEACDCIKEMSSLIDKMVKARDEVKEADDVAKYRGR